MAQLGLGLAALGRPGYMTLGHANDFASTAPAAMESQAHAVMDLAYARGVSEAAERKRIQDRDVAALHAMQKARPRKPPALPANLPLRVSAGAIALRRDKVLGVYEEPRR